MTLREIITPGAGLDIAETRDWYNSREAGIGDQFYFAFRKRLEQALQQPFLSRAQGRKKIHKVNISKFPYAIYYEIVNDELRVLAVVHGARDPKYLNYRLRRGSR